MGRTRVVLPLGQVWESAVVGEVDDKGMRSARRRKEERARTGCVKKAAPN